MVSRPAFCRIFPFAIYVGFLILETINSLLKSRSFDYFTYWDQSWSYPTKILLVMLAILWLWRNFTELALPVDVKGKDWLISIIVGVAIFVLWIDLDQPSATVGIPKVFDPVNPVSHKIDWLLVTIRLFGATIIVPVMEELFWRSFLLRWQTHPHFLYVDPSKVGFQAFLVTALLFASEHNLFLSGFVAGVAYNWLYMRTRNLWIPIVSHAVTNGLLGLWVINTGNWQFW